MGTELVAVGKSGLGLNNFEREHPAERADVVCRAHRAPTDGIRKANAMHTVDMVPTRSLRAFLNSILTP